jgi:hypothetical protein
VHQIKSKNSKMPLRIMHPAFVTLNLTHFLGTRLVTPLPDWIASWIAQTFQNPTFFVL